MQCAWTVRQFLAAVPISRSTLYEQIRAGRIRVAKVGSRTLVTTPPADFLAQCLQRQAASALVEEGGA